MADKKTHTDDSFAFEKVPLTFELSGDSLEQFEALKKKTGSQSTSALVRLLIEKTNFQKLPKAASDKSAQFSVRLPAKLRNKLVNGASRKRLSIGAALREAIARADLPAGSLENARAVPGPRPKEKVAAKKTAKKSAKKSAKKVAAKKTVTKAAKKVAKKTVKKVAAQKAAKGAKAKTAAPASAPKTVKKTAAKKAAKKTAIKKTAKKAPVARRRRQTTKRRNRSK